MGQGARNHEHLLIPQIEAIAPIRHPVCENLALCLCFRYVFSFSTTFRQIAAWIAISQSRHMLIV